MLKASFGLEIDNHFVSYEKILSPYNQFHINGKSDTFVLMRKVCKDRNQPSIIVQGKEKIRTLSEQEASNYRMAASEPDTQILSPITAEHIPQDIQTPLCEYLVKVLGEDGTLS